MLFCSSHYPISNLKLYIPVPDGTQPHVGAPTEVVDGKLYYISDNTGNTNLAHFPGEQSGDARNLSRTVPHEELIPGHIYEMEPAFVTYMFKGQQHKDFSTPKTNVTVPEYLKTTPGRISWTSPVRVEQGTSMGVTFNFSNIHAQMLTPIFEEVAFTVEIPYGVKTISTVLEYRTDNTRAPIKHIEYYVDGDPTPRISTVADAISITHTFPLAAGERINKIIYHYDKWSAFSTYVVGLNFLVMTHEPDGTTLLPLEYPVQIKAGLQTKDSAAIEMSGTASPVSSPRTMPTFTQNHVLYRIPPIAPKDGLRFGSRVGYVDRNWTNYAQWDGLSSNQIIVKSVADATKDYENVQFTVKPLTPADEALFSWMTGVRTINFGPKGFSEKRDVYYKTTKDSSWRLATTEAPTIADIQHLFHLDPGEFLTEIRVDAGTVYGSNFLQSGTNSDNSNATGQGHGVLSWGTANMLIEPILTQRHRDYFPGDPVRATLAQTGDKWFYETTISTDSEAQYINPGPGASSAYNTNKTRSSQTISTYWNYKMTRTLGVNPQLYPSNKIYYQGQTFIVSFTNHADTLNNGNGTQFEHYVTFYIAVHKYFDILKLTGNFQFQSIKDIPGSDYRLYTYTGKTIDGNNQLRTDISLYVRPDSIAPTASVVPILNAGISHDDFNSRYIVPGHENLPPYAKMQLTDMRSYPANWGITDSFQYLLGGSGAVRLEMQLMDKIELLASSGGSMVEDMLVVYDHQKNAVDIHAFFGNLSTQILEEYEMELFIPKKLRDTPSGEDSSPSIPQHIPNDIDFYLSGPVVFEDAPVGTTYLYYDLADNLIDFATATPAEKRSIARVVINVKQFPPESNLGISLPLYTDYEKKGADIADLYGYVGANRRIKTGPSAPWDNKVYTKAFPIQLSSYPLTFNRPVPKYKKT